MRTWPITEALVVICLGLLVLLPLLHVTGQSGGYADGHGHSHAHSKSTTNQAPVAVSCWLTLRSAHPLSAVRLRLEDATLLEERGEVFRIEDTVDLPIGRTGVELWLEAEWPDGTPASMIEVTIEPDGLDTRRASVWGEGPLDDILSFEWP